MLAKVIGMFRIYKKSMYAGEKTNILTLGVVNNEKYGDKETTCFTDVKCFGKLADLIDKYFDEKDRIVISGKLVTEKWEKDGVQQSKNVIIMDSFDFVEKKESKNESSSVDDSNYNDNNVISDDDIPF